MVYEITVFLVSYLVCLFVCFLATLFYLLFSPFFLSARRVFGICFSSTNVAFLMLCQLAVYFLITINGKLLLSCKLCSFHVEMWVTRYVNLSYCTETRRPYAMSKPQIITQLFQAFNSPLAQY
jgi:hypothetical protein